MERLDTDFIVVGSGVAGLRAAADLAQIGRVLILTKTELTESNSRYAQGGIAAAIGETDSAELHFADTIAAGAGLCEEDAVKVLADEGLAEVQRLIEWGTAFDRVDGKVALGLEGAHSKPRVLHAFGDATGMEIVRALSQHVRQLPNVTVIPFAFVRELLAHEGQVAGVIFAHDKRVSLAAGRAVLIASGGAGQVFRETTNPGVATGDGFALGLRAGALVRDMEFVQFHPTALKLPGVPPFLISEAVRGEGAYLIDEAGDRFVDELMPRDVVARAIFQRASIGANIYLDVRHIPVDRFSVRFPRIYSFCLEQGIDVSRQPLPVTPAAHYFMGGLYTDLHGRTSMLGLFAAGEAASSGVHGANRLASNSLLECVVFGRRAAAAMSEARAIQSPQGVERRMRVPTDIHAARKAIRETAWQHAGIVRDNAGLQQGLNKLAAIQNSWKEADASIEQIEAANLLSVAEMVMRSAIERKESRGAHYRTDYPQRDDQKFAAHSWIKSRERVVISKTRP